MLSWTSENTAFLPGPDPKPKGKHSMLPVLLVLFLICWGLMSMLIFEQGRTIEVQRSLIHSLFDDSVQLSHLRNQAAQKQRAEAQAQAEAKAHSQSQTPSTQDKSQDSSGKDSHTGKVRKPVPQKPPTDAAASEDERRNVVMI